MVIYHMQPSTGYLHFTVNGIAESVPVFDFISTAKRRNSRNEQENNVSTFTVFMSVLICKFILAGSKLPFFPFFFSFFLPTVIILYLEL